MTYIRSLVVKTHSENSTDFKCYLSGKYYVLYYCHMNIKLEYLWSESYIENNSYLLVENEKKCTYRSKIYGGKRVFLMVFFSNVSYKNTLYNNI